MSIFIGCCRRYVFVAVSLVCPLVALGADGAAANTVSGLVAMALAHHPQWPVMQAEYDAAEIGRAMSSRWELPEISGEVGRKTLRAQGDDGLVYSVGLEQAFPAPGKMRLRDELAGLQIEKAKLATRQFEVELEFDIRSAVYEWQMSREFHELLDEHARNLQRMLQAYLDRETAGVQQRLEKQMVDAALLDQKMACLEARREVDRLLAVVNQKIGRDPGTPLTISDVPPIERVDRSRTPSFSRHPKMLLHDLERSRRDLEVRQVAVESRPELTAGPYYSEESVGDDDEYTVGVVFSLPLPLWRRSEGATAVALASARQAQADTHVITRELVAQWHEAVLEANHYDGVLSLYSEEKFRVLHEAAELATRQFQAGAISVPLFLEIQREYLAAAAIRHQAMAGLNRANRNLSMMQSFGEKTDE